MKEIQILEKQKAYSIFGVPIYRKLVYIQHGKLICEHYHTPILIFDLQSKNLIHVDGFSQTDAKYITDLSRNLNLGITIYLRRPRKYRLNSIFVCHYEDEFIIPSLSADIVKFDDEITQYYLKPLTCCINEDNLYVLEYGNKIHFKDYTPKRYIPTFSDYFEKPDARIIISNGISDYIFDVFNDYAVRVVRTSMGDRVPIHLLPLRYLIENNLIPEVEFKTIIHDPWRSSVITIDKSKSWNWIKIVDGAMCTLGEYNHAVTVYEQLKQLAKQHNFLVCAIVNYTSNICVVFVDLWIRINKPEDVEILNKLGLQYEAMECEIETRNKIIRGLFPSLYDN